MADGRMSVDTWIDRYLAGKPATGIWRLMMRAREAWPLKYYGGRL